MDGSDFNTHLINSSVDLNEEITAMFTKEEEEVEVEDEEVGELLSSSLTPQNQIEMSPKDQLKRKKSRRASKLAKLTGETEEQRLEVVLRRLIYNPDR